jgi:hypothetical protein
MTNAVTMMIEIRLSRFLKKEKKEEEGNTLR